MPNVFARHSDEHRTPRLSPSGGLRVATGAILAWTTASIFAQTSPITPPQPRGTAGVPVYVEYDKKLRAAEQLNPLGGEMFGESVSLYSGQTEFSHVDIDLPGNNALPVQLRRRFVITSLMQDQSWDAAGSVGNAYGGLSNWDIEVPYIYGIFDATNKWDVSDGHANPSNSRCKQYFNPKVSQPALAVNEVWSGNKVHIRARATRSCFGSNRRTRR